MRADACSCEKCVLRRRIEEAKKAARDGEPWALADIVDELAEELESRRKAEAAR